MFFSVTTSMLAVASSRTTTLFFLKIARHIQISYFSPALRFEPFSAILKFIPLIFVVFDAVEGDLPRSNWFSFSPLATLPALESSSAND